MFHSKGLTMLFAVAVAAVAGEIVFLVFFARPPARSSAPAASAPASPAADLRSEPGTSLVPTVVTIDDPGSGLASVRMEFPDTLLSGRKELLLGFADVHERPNVVRSLTAIVDGKPVLPRDESYRRAQLVRIPLGNGARSLSVSYTIDPTLYPDWPGTLAPTDARSRITAEFGVVRSTSLLPALDLPGAWFSIQFVLPPDWNAITPWNTEGGRVRAPAGAEAGVEYLGLGPFELRELSGTPLHIAALRGATDASGVEEMLRRVTEIAGGPPTEGHAYVVTIVPNRFMHGGAAGRHTTVQSPQPEVVAHELFHWWNHGLLTGEDAAWFREGLSQYYGIRIAREVNLWSREQEAGCLADLDAEMRALERTARRSLLEASRDPNAIRVIYSKGALFWVVVEGHLRSAGHSLDEGVRRVLTSRRTALTTADLRALFREQYGALLDDLFERHVLGSEALPDMRLGPATGRSGCARPAAVLMEKTGQE